MTILIDFKEKIKKLKSSSNRFYRQIYFFARIGLIAMKFIFVSSFRNQTISVLKYRRHYHQVSNYTETNRYPDLFEICHKYLDGNENSNILSFGCSTGEEVFAIGNLMPNAKIVGVDINKWCIRECKKKSGSGKYIFLHSLSKKFDKQRSFDAIFCLAVFQHPDNCLAETKIATKYTFRQFEEQLIELDLKLNPNGLLFIDQCDFDFRDTSLSKKYSILVTDNNLFERNRPVYDLNNCRAMEITFIPRVFKKNAGVSI